MKYFVVFYRVVTKDRDFNGVMSITTKQPFPSKSNIIREISGCSDSIIRVDITNIKELTQTEYIFWNKS